jgi:hypothetical protein
MNDPLHSRYRYIAFKESGIYRRYIRDDTEKALQEAELKGKSLIIPAHGSYGPLLFDKRWKQKRAEILARDGHRCVVCKDPDNLQVHHRQYHFLAKTSQFKPPWGYENHLLISLCESCHSRGHSKYKIATLIL